MDIVLQQIRQIQALEAEYLTLKASIDCINKGMHSTTLKFKPLAITKIHPSRHQGRINSLSTVQKHRIRAPVNAQGH